MAGIQSIYDRLARCREYSKVMMLVVSLLLFSVSMSAQSLEQVTSALTEMGYENVGWYEGDSELTYVLENTAYRLAPDGIAVALDSIMSFGLPYGKACRIVFLDNSVPQLSLYRPFMASDSVRVPSRADWKVSSSIGRDWRKAVKGGLRNRSLFKFDIVVYPELMLKNLIITQIYQTLFNLAPAVEVSFWPGMKLTAQMVFPIYNDGYGTRASKIHPGFISAQQTFRLPYNTWTTLSVGAFNNDRYGADIKFRHILPWNERFSLEASAGVTATYRWDGFRCEYGTLKRFTWSVGGSYYWPLYNVQATLKAEQYLLGERGLRFDIMRHFKKATIGFYLMKADGIKVNGGFRFQIALPPYKYKRRGYIPRVTPSKNWGMSYNAGNELYYYKNYRTSPSDNIMQMNSYNPYYIKNEILND